MSFASPYLLATLVAAAARARRLPVDRAAAAAGRDLVPEPRRARLGRDPLELAPPRDRRTAARRRGAALRRGRAPARADRHDLGPRDRGARGRRVVLDGRDGRCSEPARSSAGRDHVVRESRAQPRQGRPRRVRRRPGRRHLADDQPRPPQGRHRVARPRVRDGDRRCARPRRRAHAPVDRARRDGHAGRARRVDRRHRAPLGRHPDERRAVARTTEPGSPRKPGSRSTRSRSAR